MYWLIDQPMDRKDDDMVARKELTEEQFNQLKVLVQVGRPLSQIAAYFNTTPRVLKERWAERCADPLVEWSINQLVDQLTDASMIQSEKPTQRFKVREKEPDWYSKD